MSAKRKFVDLLLNSTAFLKLKHGTRQPTSFPIWATLEVTWGGFSTGKALAVLEPSEKPSFDYLRFESDTGKLKEMLTTGQYVTDHPENTALLVVTWLMENDRVEEALKIVEEIGPYLNTLRFYPRPQKRTTTEPPAPTLPSSTPALPPTLLDGPKVSLQTTAETAQHLKKAMGREENLTIVRVWKRKAQQCHYEEYCPLEIKLLDLVLETLEVPEILRKKLQEAQEQGKNSKNLLEGLISLDEKGLPLRVCPWPFQQFPTDRERWNNAVRVALVEYHIAAKGKNVPPAEPLRYSRNPPPVAVSRRKERKVDWHDRKGKNEHRFGLRSSLLPIVEALEVIVTKGEKALTGKQVATVRAHMAQVVAKRGLPGSDRRQAYMERVKESVPPNNVPLFEVVFNRLNRLAFDGGYSADGLPVPVLGKCLEPVQNEEAPDAALAGKPIPETLQRIVERCKLGSISELAQSKLLVPSAEVLATLSNKAFPLLHGEVIPDPVIRRLYHDTSAAFTRRRSLVLVNLESQARLNELPWVVPLSAVITAHSAELRSLCLNELYRQVSAYFTRFPTIQTPNKLVSAVESLFNPIAEKTDQSQPPDGSTVAAKVSQPGEVRRRVGLTEELAADIFCDCFAKSFEDSLKVAAPRMKNTIYSAYYELDNFYAAFEAEVEKSVPTPEPASNKTEKVSQRFTDLARSVKQHWMKKASLNNQMTKTKRSAENARIIEAAQVLLTHNLIQLVEAARLAPMFDHPTFQGVLRNAASSAFREIVNLHRPRQESTRQYYERRRALATAQRQFVFFVSQLGPLDQCQVVEKCAKLALEEETKKESKKKPTDDKEKTDSAKKTEDCRPPLRAYELFLEPVINILNDRGTIQQIGNRYLQGLVKPKAEAVPLFGRSTLPVVQSSEKVAAKPLILKWYPLWELTQGVQSTKKTGQSVEDDDE